MKIETTLDYLKQQQTENESRNINEHRELKVMLESFIESADKRYANKTVEKLVYGLVALILGLVFTAITYLVLK